MESTGVPGAIHASDSAHALLQQHTGWEATGGVQVSAGCDSLANCTVQDTCAS